MPRRFLDQRLRLPLLRAVDAVAVHGSLLKASAALRTSQPALTKSLHELEDVLQLRLFDRHPRGVRPTAAGAVFVRSARRVLAELRRLDEETEVARIERDEQAGLADLGLQLAETKRLTAALQAEI